MDRAVWVQGASQIAGDICRKARTERNGCWWVADSDFLDARSVSLWGGTGGIAYFLIDAYRVTGDNQYLETAVAGARWAASEVMREGRQNRSSGLLGGDMGVAHLFCNLWDATGDPKFLEQADRVAMRVVSSSKWSACELLGGVAGALLGLAHIGARKDSDWIREASERLVRILLARIRVYKHGVYWDWSPQWPVPLCGMAHGPSGIAFVLLELAKSSRVHRSHTLVTLATSCFAYEDAFIDRKAGNWPDHRSVDGEDLNAWCHGAAGIGLARLAILDIGLKDQTPIVEMAKERCRRDLRAALAREPEELSLTPCHGLTGLGELLIEDRAESDRALVEGIGEMALRQLAIHGSVHSGYRGGGWRDLSYFMGTAGVGSYFLRLAAPEQISSLLRPSLPCNYDVAGVDGELLDECIANRLFPRLRARLLPNAQFSDHPVGTVVEDVVVASRETMVRMIDKMPIEKALRARDLLRLETAKYKLVGLTRDDGPGPVDVALGGDRRVQDAEAIIERERPLTLERGVDVRYTQWKWSDDAWDKCFSQQRGRHVVVLVTRFGKCAEFWPGPVGSKVLMLLRQPMSFTTLLRAFDDSGQQSVAHEFLLHCLGVRLVRWAD